MNFPSLIPLCRFIPSFKKWNFCLFVWLGFWSQSRIFHSYRDVTFAGKWLQILAYVRQYHEGATWKQLSLQFCIRTPQIDLLRSSKEENDQLFLCCYGRIELKYLFSWLFLNTPPPLSVKILLGIQIKAAINVSAILFQHFSTSEAILQQTQNACFIS